MKLILLLSTLIIFNSACFAVDTKGVFRKLGSEKKVLEGESFDAEINIWPSPDDDLSLISKTIQDQIFLDNFYIAEILNIKLSENNSDVVVINVKAVLTKSYAENSVFIWRYDEREIPFRIENLIPGRNKLTKEFIVLDQSDGVFNQPVKITYILLSCGLFVVILYAGKKLYLKRKKLKAQTQLMSHWNQEFKNVQSRKDMERVYQTRSEWLAIVGGETSPIKDYFQLLNQIQYKKEWTDIDKYKALESFEEIRGIFERA